MKVRKKLHFLINFAQVLVYEQATKSIHSSVFMPGLDLPHLVPGVLSQLLQSLHMGLNSDLDWEQDPQADASTHALHAGALY